MKTSQSLFPTTTKSKATLRKQPTYQVLKKVIDESDLDTDFQFAPVASTGQLQQSKTDKIQNIFRNKNNELKPCSIEDINDRPIGGTYLLRKYQKTSQLVIEDQSKRLSKKTSRSKIRQTTEKTPNAQFKSQPTLGFLQKEIKLEEARNETLKIHHNCKETYTTITHGKLSVANSMVKCQSFGESFRRCITAVGKSGRVISIASGRMKQNMKARTESSGKCSSIQTFKHPSQAEKNHLKWVEQQQHNYLDKMAILNEINYNRPLIEKFGNRYFEEILRNRYMDEPQYNNKSPFIYQIKDKMADTKFISKIKSMKCNFMERNKLVLKGRSKMTLEHQDKVQQRIQENNEGGKRWQGFDEQLFAECQ